MLEEGRLLMDASPREVFSKAEEMKSLRLGVPQASELAYYLKKGGKDLGEQTVLTPEEFIAAYFKEKQ